MNVVSDFVTKTNAGLNGYEKLLENMKACYEKRSAFPYSKRVWNSG